MGVVLLAKRKVASALSVVASSTSVEPEPLTLPGRTTSAVSGCMGAPRKVLSVTAWTLTLRMSGMVQPVSS